ncbi:glycosyltransferase family 2 protein [Nocardioides sp. KC13]|uniref:Glycosyltransferase family 2 protein n=1 Tax=Nocardioides turkmenicus TaxID=2711220 RepID=A0A6M1R4K0_9ACTN|nr:glycosyltransferase family 2 protein [Nocardioides sp. KC13]NGN92578.1 glycosyltransferase family 2 protein [Nocardioides sp. KC13]
MTEPELSVVVPTRDLGPWVGELLSSILEDQSTDQMSLDLEVVLVDDGSTDDTLEIAQAYAARDPRLKVVRSPGTGGGQARNHGVSLARGEFLAFADGDDLVPRGAYAAMLRKTRETGSDMVVGRFFKLFSDRVWWPVRAWPAFDEERTLVRLADAPSALRNRACWNRVFRRSFWDSAQISFPDATRSNDIEPMVHALTTARFDIITDTVYVYRDRPGPGSMTAKSHSAAGLISYLEQELRCARRIIEVGDPKVRAEYASLVFAADGWTAIARALRGMPVVDAAALEPARLMISELVGLFDDGVIDDLDDVKRWGWRLVESGKWATVARLIGEDVRWGDRTTADLLESLRLVADSDVVPLRTLQQPLIHVMTTIAPSDESLVGDDLADLVLKHRDLFTAVAEAAADPGWRLNRIMVALEDGPELVRQVVAGATDPVTATSLSLVDGRVHLRLAHTMVGAERLQVVFVRDSRRRTFDYDTAELASGELEVVVPTSTLPGGRWRVRFEGRDALGEFDGPVIIREDVIGERIGERAQVVQLDGRPCHGIEIPLSFGERGVRKARRVAGGIVRRVRR